MSALPPANSRRSTPSGATCSNSSPACSPTGCSPPSGAALPRRYIAHEDDLPVLRGRLNVTRQVTHLAVRPDRLACRYDELSEDTPLNRVLKAAVTRLARLVRAPANIRSLAELAARFEAVSDSPYPLREAVRLDRTNTAFHDLHRMACLFLDDEWQSTKSGAADGFALLFPMNELFEKFVGRCLKRALAPRAVHLQRRGRCALSDDRGGLFETRPDMVAETLEGPVVLDTSGRSSNAAGTTRESSASRRVTSTRCSPMPAPGTQLA